MAKTARSAADFLPPVHTLDRLAKAVQSCQGCDLYEHATQAVFGEGRAGARLLLIGEQPGDKEDLAGQPFVGPAGKLLDDVLADVGIERDDMFVTNAVKHFKWTPRGVKRLHAKPSSREVTACRPWLDAEIEAIEPEMIVCLGATAAQAILGPKFRVTRQRGEFIASDLAPWVMATYHPSAILRAPDEEARSRMRKAFTSDLRKAARRLNRAG